ncbi:MAG: hypothetical protein JW867_01260 [Candidatus Omnitrophica bacterium]|nr:hypothetical protein [Candidatus Omnitrophota bacterium]
MSEHISDIIKNYLKKIDQDAQKRDTINNLISQILDEYTKKQTQIISIGQKEVVFGVGSSSVLYNFNLHKKEILKTIKDSIIGIEDIKVKIQQ